MAERKKGGRPRQFQDPVTQPIRMERSEQERAERLAERDGVSLAQILRKAVNFYLKKRGV